MLDTDTKRRIDTARDILVGKVPDPKSQVEQITIALIYKFMDDMDAESEELGGKRKFFTGDHARYGWAKLMAPSLGGHEMLGLYRSPKHRCRRCVPATAGLRKGPACCCSGRPAAASRIWARRSGCHCWRRAGGRAHRSTVRSPGTAACSAWQVPARLKPSSRTRKLREPA